MTQKESYSRFIDDVTFQTCLLFEVNNPDVIEDFRDSLEAGMIEEIIRCKDTINVVSNKYKHGAGTTDGFLRTALIASGISDDGLLPFKYDYKVTPLVNDFELGCHAMNRYIEMENDMYGEYYMPASLRLAFNSIDKDYIDMEEILKAFFYLNDRTSNLILDIDGYLEKSALKAIWDVEKKLLKAKKLDDTICARIIDEVCNSDEHYDFNRRTALFAIASADYHFNMDGDLTMKEIANVRKLINANLSDDEDDIINRYGLDFNKMIENESRNYIYKKKNREV